jgi:nucleoside-diphosphate-sugar epimerase
LREFSTVKHCLVTGSTGFIGRFLCQQLRDRGVRIRALARHREDGPWDDFVEADLGETRLSSSVLEGIDSVFHLAGKAHALSELTGEEHEYGRVNIGGMDALLGIVPASTVSRFVFFSTVKAMGDDDEKCMDEAWGAPPTTPYGISKRESERRLLAFGKSNDIHVSVLRLPLVYGRGVKGNLWKMMDAIERGRFPALPDIGNRRSLVHVDDVVRAAFLVTKSPDADGQVYIVTDGQPYSTNEICGMMREALGKPALGWSMPVAMLGVLATAGDLIGRVRGRRFVFDSDAYRKLLGSAWYSSRKIEQELGFRPSRSLRDGVEEMVTAYRGAGGTSLDASPI